jgi:hypothetical protein
VEVGKKCTWTFGIVLVVFPHLPWKTGHKKHRGIRNTH